MCEARGLMPMWDPVTDEILWYCKPHYWELQDSDRVLISVDEELV